MRIPLPSRHGSNVQHNINPINVRLLNPLGVQIWASEEVTTNEACAQGLATESVKASGGEDLATEIYIPSSLRIEGLK